MITCSSLRTKLTRQLGDPVKISKETLNIPSLNEAIIQREEETKQLIAVSTQVALFEQALGKMLYTYGLSPEEILELVTEKLSALTNYTWKPNVDNSKTPTDG